MNDETAKNSNLTEEDFSPIANLEKTIKKKYRNRYLIILIVILFPIILVVTLGEIHGNLSNVISENNAINSNKENVLKIEHDNSQKNYKVMYTFDFIPTVIQVISDGSNLIIILVGLFIFLFFQYLIKYLFDYTIELKKLENEVQLLKMKHDHEFLMRSDDFHNNKTLED